MDYSLQSDHSSLADRWRMDQGSSSLASQGEQLDDFAAGKAMTDTGAQGDRSWVDDPVGRTCSAGPVGQ